MSQKVGTKPDWGAAYETNQWVWWLLVPFLCAASNLVPFSRNTGELWPQRQWLPLGFVSLWLIGTGMHTSLARGLGQSELGRKWQEDAEIQGLTEAESCKGWFDTLYRGNHGNSQRFTTLYPLWEGCFQNCGKCVEALVHRPGKRSV